MKVVLFCGGLGTRLREYSDTIPKPLVPIGYRPILWHLMKYYAHFGHKEFILCLGYRGDLIKEYFLKYDECLSNDFTLQSGGKDISLHRRDIADWKITFVETGSKSNIGQRLQRVRPYVEKEEMFLANYSDGLSDLDLNSYTAAFQRSGAIAGFLSVRPAQSFHAVYSDEQNLVTRVESINTAEVWINGGFFILRPELFSYMEEGDELVEHPFNRLIAKRRLFTQQHKGFWAAMDTFKDKMTFDGLHERGDLKWALWEK